MKPINIEVNTYTVAWQAWFEKCQALVKEYMTQNYPHNTPEELIFTFGQRYIKVWKQTILKDAQGKPFSFSIWAFIDRTNGDVLKPATSNAPAKHARGNIFDSYNGMKTISAYGPAYLR